MSLQTSTSFMPEKLRILSGSALKMLAMAIMLIDHTASFLLRHYPPAIAPWFQIGSTTYSLYRVMRDVGRAAFPIFCFLLPCSLSACCCFLQSPIFSKQITDIKALYFSWSCTGCISTNLHRQLLEAAGWSMNGRLALLLSLWICTMKNEDLFRGNG